MKVGALFAGYGGLELALDQVFPGQTRVAWVSDVEPGPSKVLQHRFPDAPNLGDITKINWANVEPVDIITGGSPCQDLSHAGRRAGMRSGTRSGLWSAMCDAIETIQPQLVVWENVRGALSATAEAGDVESCKFCVDEDNGTIHLRALGRVLGDLAEVGYDAAWSGLRAADIGAPHGRWRIFVLAWPAGNTQGQYQHAWGSSKPPIHHQAGKPGGTVRHPERQGWGTAGIPTSPQAQTNGPPAFPSGPTGTPGLILLPTPAVNDMGEGKDIESWDERAARQQAADGRPAPHGRSLDVELRRLEQGNAQCELLPTSKATNNENRQSDQFGQSANFHGLISGHIPWGRYQDAITRWERAFGRPAPPPTAIHGKSTKPRLNPVFVEWMMGLPAGWVTDTSVELSRAEQLRILGNGVVPQQAAAAITYLLHVRTQVAA